MGRCATGQYKSELTTLKVKLEAEDGALSGNYSIKKEWYLLFELDPVESEDEAMSQPDWAPKMTPSP